MVKSLLVGLIAIFISFVWILVAFLIGSDNFFHNKEARAGFAIMYCMSCPLIGMGASVAYYENTKK